MGKSFFTIALCFFCGYVFGQDYSNLIEKGKYGKVYQKCSKKLSKTPDDIELLYFTAVVTSRQAAGKLCDPRQSYTYYLKAVNLFNSTLDERRLEKLEKIPINSKAFKVLSDSIFTSGLAFAATANTEASYISYLNTYTLAGDYYKQIAKAERNRLAFATALSANSIAAFTEFVYKYPDALQVTEAWSNVYRLAYLDAQSENTIQSYESFISKYPKAPQVGNANQAIHLLAFEEAKRVDNSTAYKNFIDTYPNSIQNAEATGLYQLRQFEENTVPGMWESYRDFYQNFKGPYRNIAGDSLLFISIEKMIPKAMLFCLENNIGDAKQIVPVYYNLLSSDGELSSLNYFKEKFGQYLYLIGQFQSDYELAKFAASIGLTNDMAPAALNTEMDKRLKREGAKTGVITISLMWDNFNDIDLHCVDPNGEEIFFGNKNSRSGGELDVDMNVQPESDQPVENIYWENKKAPKGRYLVLVNHYSNHQCFDCDDPTTYTIVVKHNNIVKEFKGSITHGEPKKLVYSFDFLDRNYGELELSKETFAKLDNYIRRAPGKELSFVALQRILSKDIEQKNWGDAIEKMKAYANVFQGNKKYDALYSDLRERKNYTIDIRSLSNVNTTTGEEYSPVVSANSRSLYFCGYNRGDGVGGEDIFVSKYKNNEWDLPSVIPGLSKSESNDAIMAVSSDETKAIIFHNGKLAYSEKYINGWSNLTYFPDEVNNCSWNGDAMITSDGNALVYASVREFDGYGLFYQHNEFYHATQAYFSDLYVSIRNSEGWSKPINLGEMINTPYIERSPFLHPDMKTLYFSSDGHGGFGKMDVYMSTRISDTCWDCWTEPVNLGKEINTTKDDWGYRISTDGATAYFSKKGIFSGSDDLFSFVLPLNLRPDVVSRIEGELKNSRNEPISAVIRWEDLESNKVIGTSKSDPIDGTYFIVLPMGKNYGYYIEDSTYFPLSQNLDLRTTTTAVDIKKDIKVVSFEEMIDEGLAVPMNNLFFEFGKHNVLPASIPELTRISGIIQRYNLKVEIAGHTDDVSDDKFNQQLSEKRADAVKDFLISKGCSMSLLVTKGYGESKPVAPNDSEENRAKNRRVELRFIK